MGGAVAITAAPDLPVAAVVADAAYAVLENPIANRMRERRYPFARLGSRLVVAAASVRARTLLRQPIQRVATNRPARAAADRAARGSPGGLDPGGAAVRGGQGTEGANGRRRRCAQRRARRGGARQYERRVLEFFQRHLDGWRRIIAPGAAPRLSVRNTTRLRSLHGCHEGPRRR